MARYNAMRNYNKYSNGGVASLRPSSASMPMSSPNTLLGTSMRNQYGDNIHGYQGGTSSAYARFKPLIKGGRRRFQEESDFEKMFRDIEMKRERGTAWAGAGKWGGTLLSWLIRKAAKVPKDTGELAIDPIFEGLGSYIGGKLGYGKDVDISTKGPWYKPARKELKGYQEDIGDLWGDFAKAQTLESFGEGVYNVFGPKLPGEEEKEASQEDLYQRAGGEEVFEGMTDWQKLVSEKTSDLQSFAPKVPSKDDIPDYSSFDTFNSAFAEAYNIGGAGSIFIWNGKEYEVKF